MRVPNSSLPALAIVATVAAAAPSLASSITYTETVTGTGVINGLGFSGASVTLALSGNTADVAKIGPLALIFGTATVNVGGAESATFSGSTEVFDDQTDAIVGFKDGVPPVNIDILDTSAAAFSAYDLTTSTGPISGTAAVNFLTAFATTNGHDFILDSTSGLATFTATIGVGAAAIPEPASLALLAVGLTGFGLIRRRKA